MHISTLLALTGIGITSASATTCVRSTSSSSSSSSSPSSTSNGCALLKNHLNSSIFYPGTPVYDYENQYFWSNTEILSPACVFRPQSSVQLANGIKYLADAEEKFAVRGGGHMGIEGSNNIDNGVLIVMSNLTTLELSHDRSVVSIGPSHRWIDVYNYLGNYSLAAPGGRLSPVGVPGLLLAGGVNFYGNQVGWSCDSVINYEVVLANGTLTQANSTHHPNLFWALKGGSSNFGIVTRFDMLTIKSEGAWAGIHTVSGEYLDQFLEAAATYASNISDPKSHIVPAVIPGPNNTLLGSVILFYDSPNTSYPEIFKPFTDIPAVSSTLGFKTLSEFANECGQAVTPHINDIFVAGTIKSTTYTSLLQGISIINTTFFNALPDLYSRIPTENISLVELDWQPIGASWMQASASRGGNALGLDASQIYLCYAEVVEWIGSEYDEIVYEWVQDATERINNATAAVGLFDGFNYMGDAAGFQSIFPGYGEENHKRLQEIAMQYDPTGVFQRLMPGGFKVF